MFFYGTAGLAWTDVKVIATETASTDFFNNFDLTAAATSPRGGVINNGFIGNQTDTNFSKTSDDVQMGWTGGCGAEWAINDKMTLGVEYRHSDYGSHTYHFASNDNVIFPGDTKVDLDTDQVTLRFNILISHFFGH
jgi:opacity protein-like surface antigen